MLCTMTGTVQALGQLLQKDGEDATPKQVGMNAATAVTTDDQQPEKDTNIQDGDHNNNNPTSTKDGANSLAKDDAKTESDKVD